MSHLENLQNTISQLQNQSKTLNSLTEVYAKAEKTEENYRQNLELFEKLRQQLESYENLLDQKIISISKQNTDSVSALQATNQKIEQAESQIKKTKEDLDNQGSSIEAHLKEVKSQNKAFYEQTQDLLVQKTDNLHANHEKFYLETTERIQNRLAALTQKNEDFYSLTSHTLATQLENLDKQTTAFYERSTEGIRNNLSDFASHTKERDEELEKMLVSKVDIIQQENQTLHIQANSLFEKLEKTYSQFKAVLDRLSEFQMQFDTIGANLENQEQEIHNQSESLKEAQENLQENQKSQFDTFSDYQKKALKFIYDNQSKEFKEIKEELVNKFELQSESYTQNQKKLEEEISLQQKNQLVSLQTAQNEAITPIKEQISEELTLQKSKIEKISTFQIVIFITLLINIGLLIYLLFK
ncbi:hypothetical protein WAF17_15880 [Bernardetia sp. ABR2-2B]|uniref:hypothetical protein n=1 Tax=Bernardetia sp. ABR2-2B TaxID=3127472 RepID=UPI0030CDEE0C